MGYSGITDILGKTLQLTIRHKTKDPFSLTTFRAADSDDDITVTDGNDDEDNFSAQNLLREMMSLEQIKLESPQDSEDK